MSLGATPLRGPGTRYGVTMGRGRVVRQPVAPDPRLVCDGVGRSFCEDLCATAVIGRTLLMNVKYCQLPCQTTFREVIAPTEGLSGGYPPGGSSGGAGGGSAATPTTITTTARYPTWLPAPGSSRKTVPTRAGFSTP